MKITLDPMPALRLAAVAKVNAHFDSKAQPHRDAAHSMKRAVAEAGAPFPDWFEQEAGLRGIEPGALASLVMSKPDNIAEREVLRQTAMAKIDSAKTPNDLDDISDDFQ